MNEDIRVDQIKIIKNWLGTGSINIFGLPFAGKDTHGAELAELFGAAMFGGGDILRSDGMPKHVQDLIGTGALAEREDYLKIILPYFSKPEFHDKPLILSTVGRWHGEEEGVLEATRTSNHPLKAVIWLEITEAEMRKRWTISQALNDRNGRDDDAEHALDVRLNEFKNKTVPVMNFYKEHNLLLKIDGKPEMKVVSQNIINALYKKATNG